MSKLFIKNSLSNKKEEFIPLNDKKVGVYTCGPTVYSPASIGNFRTYVAADVLVRVLKYNGYGVSYVMNITDVGHLTGDNFGDADTGEDRLEKAAKKERKTAWEIASFYEDAFVSDFDKLNLERPIVFAKATEHIDEQVALIKKLEAQRLTYKITDGVYFDTQAFEKSGGVYGKLSTLDVIKEGARVEPNLEKKNPRDFALWKFSSKDKKRDMEWESPWGTGFPGWHIECSAMSMKYLGDTFDIHVGGEDLRSIHHPNEMAQSEGATGKPLAMYFMHAAFLKVDGGKMGKSLGNAYSLDDIAKKGFGPLDLRYFYLSARYNDSINFTWDTLLASQKSLYSARKIINGIKKGERTILSSEKNEKVDGYRRDFGDAVNDDLNTPKALAVFWEMLKSNIPSPDKYDLAMLFDEVFGLDLGKVVQSLEIPSEVDDLLEKRKALRKAGDYKKADEIRKKIEKLGYKVSDGEIKAVATKG